MDGMEAARRIRERDDKVVIIFITAAPQYAISDMRCARCRTCSSRCVVRVLAGTEEVDRHGAAQ